MTVLVTGATGFVGSAVVRRLLAEKLPVRVMLRKHSNVRNIDGLPVERVTGDLTDKESLLKALQGCETLFHVAADYRLWARQPQQLYESNVDGTVNLMQAAQAVKIKRIVYTSSVATLGLLSDGQSADENTPSTEEDMIGDYKRSKYLAEQAVKNMVREHGLPAVIVNPSTPVGPYDIKPTPTGKMIVDALTGKMPVYVDTGLNIVHVDDVAEGHWLAYCHGEIGERYILGNQNMSLQQILQMISKIADVPAPKFKIPITVPLVAAYFAEFWVKLLGTGEPMVSIDSVKMSKKKMYFSSGKAERELGYKPRLVEEAFIDAIQWFRKEKYC